MSHVILKRNDNTEEKIHVSNIYCIGLNYSNHIAEMKSEKPSEPMVFMKPTSAIVYNNDSIIIPKISNDAHHEGEIVILIGQDGKDVSIKDANNYILGIGIGIDVTLRDIQSEAKKKGKPWLVSKGFATSAPVSEFLPVENFQDLKNLQIQLFVNDQLRQKGNSQEMIFDFSEVISYISSIFSLKAGDLIYTGTPAGVAQMVNGDKVKVTLDSVIQLNVDVKDLNVN